METNLTLSVATTIGKLTLAEHSTSSPYLHKGDHQSVKRFLAKLLATLPETLPNYNKSSQTFQNPTWWEMIYMGLYSYLGPTAIKIRREGQKHAKLARAQQKAKETKNNSNQTKSKGATPTSQEETPNKSLRNHTYVEVIFPAQEEWKDWKEKQPIMASIFSQLTEHVFERIPSLAIHKMVIPSNINKSIPTISNKTSDSLYPTKQADLNNYITQFLFPRKQLHPKGECYSATWVPQMK
jgi:hypothetical protein